MATATKKTKPADPFLDHAAAVSQATDDVNDYADAVDEARADVEAMRGRIRSGDKDVTPADLARAVAGVEFAALRQHGAALRLYALRSSTPYRPVVAEAVAEALSAHYGYEYLSVDKVPADQHDGSAPTGYVVQAKGAERGWGGPGATTSPLTAPVSIHLHRHGVSWVKPLNHGEVLDALTATGLVAHKNGFSSGEVLSILNQPVTLSVPKDDVKSSMLAPERPSRPTPPRLVFDTAVPDRSTGGDMYT